MKRFWLISLLSLVVVLFVGAFGAGAQIIEPPICDPTRCDPVPPPCVCPPDAFRCACPPIVPGVFTNPDWLKIDYHRVNVEIENQIARTQIDMQFTNEGSGLAEGTFVFPLPLGASVDQLTMYINNTPIEARIMQADEARAYYDSIVRQYRDPALLEYIGTQAVQANIFPIPPGEKRRIELAYTQALTSDNGLIGYRYPLEVTRLTNRRAVESMSISVRVTSADRIGTIYSPSHNIAISREGDRAFRVGFEAGRFAPDQDFMLYYGVSSDAISLNLLTYRESATGDGFFMLLVNPPSELDEAQVIARDVIIVLDQSGSMDGEKWRQARQAAIYVLENLNPRDRFNVILFSTGWRTFSTQLEPAPVANEAVDWLQGMYPEGGTDINGALTTALSMADDERPTAVLFLTDGLPTEGVTDPARILSNLEAAAKPNVRVFSFGVGDDVDTFLLDRIVQSFRGTGAYVRPNQRIDEEVAALYSKIGAPALTNLELTFDGVRVDTLYPAALPDLYAGTQQIIVGRYRGSADAGSIRLTGGANGRMTEIVLDDAHFRARAGGEPFIARLWATRRIGELLNQIRLNGENREMIDSIVSLSVRYGIITPYTSFLIDENDILTQSGRDQAAAEMAQSARSLSIQSSGAAAVSAADAFSNMAGAAAPAPQPTMTASSFPASPVGAERSEGGTFGYSSVPANPIQTVGGKTFLWQDGVWTDTTYDPDLMEPIKVVFLSDDYFDLLLAHPDLGQFFAIGEQVIVVLDGAAYQVVAEA